MKPKQSKITLAFFIWMLAFSYHYKSQIIFIEILQAILKSGLTQRFMMKEEERDHHLQEKFKK